MKIKGAIFDLDGILPDFMFICGTIAEDYLIRRRTPPEYALNEKFKTMSIEYTTKHYQSPINEQKKIKKTTDYHIN